jgi:hypothetical protein
MPDNRRKGGVSLTLERLEDRLAPSVTPLSQSFDTTSIGRLPLGWAQWSSTGKPAFSVSGQMPASPSHSLAASTPTNWVSASAWNLTQEPADIEVGASLFANNHMPVALVARASGLNTATPTYYGVQVVGGLQVVLYRMHHGVITGLARVATVQPLTPEWVRVTFSLSGTTLRAQVFRMDTGQYLDPSGHWQATPTWAIHATDGAITSGGLVGLTRLASYAGTVYLDDFRAFSSAGDLQPPTATLTSPAASGTVSGMVPVHVNASDNVGVAHVDFYLDGTLQVRDRQAPYTWFFNSSAASKGVHRLAAVAYDIAGNATMATESVTIANGAAPPPPPPPTPTPPAPTIRQKYPWIRVAELAYSARQLDSFGRQLLAKSVDLAITDFAGLVPQVTAASPTTTQLLYTNLSTLYLDLLADWQSYAAAHGYNPEGAFYHVTQATPYAGWSPSSRPVNWFWNVYRSGSAPAYYTAAAPGRTAGLYTKFGAAAGDALYVGYPMPFRQISLSLVSLPSSRWATAIEYPTAVDVYGNPTAWARLPRLADGTNGVKTGSGTIWFNPPSNWKPVRIKGSAPMYYVRFRTTSSGTPPVARSILGADYTGAGGKGTGVIPAFDTSADLNHDGYLNNAEFARRKPGMNARFLYQSRALYAHYGEMRFATNPSDPAFRAWAANYLQRLMRGQPSPVGVLIDNSLGTAQLLVGKGLRESTATYQQNYASLLHALTYVVSPRPLMANTSNGAVIRGITGAYEEFSFRALAGTWQGFEGVAHRVAAQLALRTPSPYLVLDSLPTGGSPTDPRTQMATLAYYYLIASPTRTFINFFGGAETSTSWTRHWVPAVTYNVGRPLGSWSLRASGADPESPSKTYRVYQRAYSNALVLYKPLSVNPITGARGTLDGATGTTLTLNRTYRLLRADGTLGAAVTKVTLRNGEGAILIKV